MVSVMLNNSSVWTDIIFIATCTVQSVLPYCVMKKRYIYGYSFGHRQFEHRQSQRMGTAVTM